MTRMEINESRIPVFVYAKESQLWNYVGFSESRIQDVKEPHAAREPQFGHVCYIMIIKLTSVESERDFSAAELIASKIKSNSKDEAIETLSFLRFPLNTDT